MDLVMLIGLQAAGKSTFCQARLAGGHDVVSKDLLRNMRQPTSRQAEQIAAALRAGRSVAVDNTNATLADRAALIAQARAFGARVVGYYFEPDLAGSRARNAARAVGRVPPVALHVTARRLRPPSYEEGFDELYGVRIAPENAAFLVEAWPKLTSG